MLAPGQLIAGRYRLERPVGKGGMGSVWVAQHVELDRR
jgi:serine/threonine-protein kinase